MKTKWIFYVRTHECPETVTHRVEADFASLAMIGRNSCAIVFWVKPKWYSRRRAVAMFDWDYVTAVANEAPVAEDWLAKAKVKISTGDGQ